MRMLRTPVQTPGHVLMPLALLFCLTPWASSALALMVGVGIALLWGNPYLDRTRKLTRPMLSWSIIGLGAGMDLMAVGRAGYQGFFVTALALSLTLLGGWLLGKLLAIPPRTALLINVGTAICGGSAIAAVASAIRARDHEISVALGIVFVLNACALVIFPPLGHLFQLNAPQFGLWSALAIHDTSSVVGATMQYGRRALEVGTTVKLVRALWIIPVTLFFANLHNRQEKSSTPPKYPWFILGFLLTSAVVTFLPPLQPFGHQVEWLAKRGLIVTLFLIGSGLTRSTLKAVGLRPLLHGVILWFVVASVNLLAVRITG